MPDRPIAPQPREDDTAFDRALRPTLLAEFPGQDRLKENLGILIQAARRRGEALDHVLFYGPPGLGKTSLAHIVANEMKVNVRVTAGPAIERTGDLAAILTNLKAGDVLFIDEIHRLGRAIEEVLYPAMEDFALDFVIGKGPSARSIRLNLPHFTVIGATTRLALVSSPLRGRFGAVYRLDYYEQHVLEEIITRGAKLLEVQIDPSGQAEIARRGRGTPRAALRLLRRVRDYAQVRGDGAIDGQLAAAALSLLDVDPLGLDDLDRRALGLTFQYPADWRKTTGPVAANPRAQRIELARPSQPAGHNAEILIDVRPKSGDALLTWVKQRLPTGSLMLSSDYLESGFKNLKDYNARLNGLPAIFDYQPEHGSGTPNMAALFVADKQSVYQFTYHGDIPDDSVNRVAYLRLLNTVTLSGTTRSGIILPASAFTAGIDLATFK